MECVQAVRMKFNQKNVCVGDMVELQNGTIGTVADVAPEFIGYKTRGNPLMQFVPYDKIKELTTSAEIEADKIIEKTKNNDIEAVAQFRALNKEQQIELVGHLTYEELRKLCDLTFHDFPITRQWGVTVRAIWMGTWGKHAKTPPADGKYDGMYEISRGKKVSEWLKETGHKFKKGE